MTKILKRTTAMFLVLMMIFSCITGLGITASAASGANIEYKGSITWNLTTLGDFRVDGEQAFCIKNKKGTPWTGSDFNPTQVYENKQMANVLYYGWGGPGCIFTNRNEGIVCTSAALSAIYCGAGNSYGQGQTGTQQLLQLARDNAMPNYHLKPTKSNLAVTVKNKKQVSESTQITGDKKNTCVIPVPSGVTLVNETKKTSTTNGKATVNGNDTIHFEAALDYAGNFTSGTVTGSFLKMQPVIAVPASDSSLQTLCSPREVVDPASQFTITAKFEKRNGELYIIKTSDDNVVENIQITIQGITNPDICYVQRTNARGEIAGEMPVGEYLITETPINKYVTIPPKKVEVVAGETTSVSFRNVIPKSYVYTDKIDKYSGCGVGGAEFTVYEDEACTKIATNSEGSNAAADNTFVAKASGRAISKAEYYGSTSGITYYCKETKAPTGYNLNDTVYPVTLTSDDNGKKVAFGEDVDSNKDKVVEDTPTTIGGRVAIRKVEGTSTDSLIDLEKPSNSLRGCTWTVTAEENIMGSDGNLLYKKGDTVTSISPYKLELAYTLMIPNVGAGGKFRITETEAPYGYQNLGRYVIYKFGNPATSTINTTDDGVRYIDGTIESYSPEATGNESIELAKGTFIDAPITGRVNVNKTYTYKDADGKVTTEAVKGAKFEVRAATKFVDMEKFGSKTLYEVGDLIGTIDMTNSTTGSLDIAKIGGGGRISVIEVQAPEGCYCDKTPHELDLYPDFVDENGVAVAIGEDVDETDSKEVGDFSLTVDNQPSYGVLQLEKTKEVINEDGTTSKETVPIEGVQFRLQKAAGATPAVDTTATTNAQGQITKALYAGTYTVTELDSGEATKDVVISAAQTVTIEAEKFNTVEINNELRRGSVEGKKVNEKGEPLKGVEFGLFEKDEKAFTESNTLYGTTFAKTDETGSFKFNNIPYGEYIVREISCLDGYKLNDKNYPVTIDKDGIKVELGNIVNDTLKGNLKVIKSAEDNFVEGVQFCLFGTSTLGTAVDMTATTDANGVAEFKDVLIGDNYTVEEVDTKDYYIVPNSQNATIDWSEAQELSFNNELKKGAVEIKKTSEDKIIEGFKFRLQGTSTSGQKVDMTATTDAEGIARFNEVLIGTYNVSEIDTPAEYLQPIDQKVVVSYDTVAKKGITSKLSFYNELDKPKIGTTAKDKETGTHEAFVSPTTTIVDTIKYEGLIVGKEYTVNGTLMDKATGKELLVDGKTVTATKKFTATNKDGLVDVEFTFNSTALQGISTVVFESVLYKDVEIATHTDINDEEQTVTFETPEIHTTALDKETGTHEAFVSPTTTIIDRVALPAKLIEGKEYTIKGIEYVQSTGEKLLVDGKEVTSEKTFTYTKDMESVDIEFTFDSSALKGISVTTFEYLYYEGIEVSTHADINDEGQTVTFETPEIHTTALDKATGTHEAFVSPTTTIVDTVKYEGLIVGKEYTVNGTLMDKATGKELLVDGKTVTATKKFTATNKDGLVDVEFTFNSTALQGISTVVFESVLYKDVEIATHTDINDEEQTVTFKETPTEPTVPTTEAPTVPTTEAPTVPTTEAPTTPGNGTITTGSGTGSGTTGSGTSQTGDTTPIWLLISLAVVMCGSVVTIVVARRKKSNRSTK